MSKQTVVAKIYDKKGRLLATGHNSYTKTHPKQAYYASKAGFGRKNYLHAEIAAIIRGNNRYPRGRLHSIRVERRARNGNLVLAKPCAICMLAIKEAGIKQITYSL